MEKKEKKRKNTFHSHGLTSSLNVSTPLLLHLFLSPVKPEISDFFHHCQMKTQGDTGTQRATEGFVNQQSWR